MVDILQRIAAVLMSLLMTFLSSIGLARSNYEVTEVAYGTSAQQVMDVYVPAKAASNATNSAVIILHDGFFESGSKSDLQSTCQTIANRGYIAVAMDYTLLDANNKAITYYTMLEDIRLATKALAEFSATNKLNIRKVALAGDSAGGSLALNFAYSRKTQMPFDLAFVAARVAPSDFRYDQWKGFVTDEEYVAMYNKLTGANVTVADLTGANAGSITRNATMLSPVYYVNKSSVPTLFGYAKNDSVVPYANKDALENALTANGVAHDYVDYPSSGHDLGNLWNSLFQTADYSDVLLKYCATYLG